MSNKNLFKQSAFYGGLSDDPEFYDDTVFAKSANFDIISHPHKLVPTRKWEVVQEDSPGDNKEITKLLYDGNKVYGLGENSSGDVDIFESSASSPGFDSIVTSVTGSHSRPQYNLFLDYRGKIYGWDSREEIWEFDKSTGVLTNEKFSPASDDDFSAHQGIISQGRAYVPYGRYVGTIHNGNWVEDALILEEGYTICARIVEWNDFIAIPVVDEKRHSRVYLWDGVSVAPKTHIDFGYGEIQELHDQLGVLTAIVHWGRNLTEAEEKTVVKRYLGGSVTIFKDFPTEDGFFCDGSAMGDNKLYFPTKEGIWVIGRKSERYPLSVSLHKQYPPSADPNDDNDFNADDVILVGSELWVAGDNNGEPTVWKITSQSTDWDDAYIETQITNSNEMGVKKEIHEVIVEFEPLSDGADVSGYYRVNRSEEYTKIFEVSEEGQTIVVKTKEINGLDFKKYNTAQFKFESHDGAVITFIQIDGKILYQKRD